MIAAVQFEVALPEPIATRAYIFHLQVVAIGNMAAWSATLISMGVFVVAAVVAFSPIILHGGAVNDLEHANKGAENSPERMNNALPGNVEPATRGIHSLKLPSRLCRERTEFNKKWDGWPIPAVCGMLR